MKNFSGLIDQATRSTHESLIQQLALFSEDRSRTRTEDISKQGDYPIFIRFIRNILVHLTVSSLHPGGTVDGFVVLLMALRLSGEGIDAWNQQAHQSDEIMPNILSYIRDHPPAIVLIDTQAPEFEHRTLCAGQGYSWGSVEKGNDAKNEFFISAELVEAYICLEKARSGGSSLDPKDKNVLVFLQIVILVTTLHELAHCLTKWMFGSLITPRLCFGGKKGEGGDVIERILFDGILCIEWKRSDFNNRQLRMRTIKDLYLQSSQEEHNGGFAIHKLALDDLERTVNSIKSYRIYQPAYTLDEHGLSDCDIGSVDARCIRRQASSPAW
ncbi:uncharacterized protein EV420DRAFT_1639022 [Desarmillaria tabescens]|uniref:Uncharacterized protein n=1 Tax=Armillaria tabescens TaxID=1929756 RepID=A0AA39NCC3_ARMTA|nr:uncharacterized protein EV420DRAFT_1639022 [Desarmillaria tabescens]KAK0462934.1 hypothetical protein EV420DRAFT_1639022 [Desarmillaria tabescens]